MDKHVNGYAFFLEISEENICMDAIYLYVRLPVIFKGLYNRLLLLMVYYEYIKTVKYP